MPSPTTRRRGGAGGRRDQDEGPRLAAAHLLRRQHHVRRVGIVQQHLERRCAVDDPGLMQPAEMSVGPDERGEHRRPAMDDAGARAAELVDIVAVEIRRLRREAQAWAYRRHDETATPEVISGDRAVNVLGRLPLLIEPLAFGLAIFAGLRLALALLGLARARQAGDHVRIDRPDTAEPLDCALEVEAFEQLHQFDDIAAVVADGTDPARAVLEDLEPAVALLAAAHRARARQLAAGLAQLHAILRDDVGERVAGLEIVELGG
jgi:hypothetical protein